jgi:hypothetical protein
MGIAPSAAKEEQLTKQLSQIAESFRKSGVFSSISIMKTTTFAEGVNYGNQALASAFFKPNIIFLSMMEDEVFINDYPLIIEESRKLQLGIILYVLHPKALLGQKQKINIWIDDRHNNWNVEHNTGNIDLAILVSYKLMQNWNASICLISIYNNTLDEEKANKFLFDIVDLARMPITNTIALGGKLEDLILTSPFADLNIFAIENEINLPFYRKMTNITNTSCLFIQDSGHENILA